PLHSWSWTLCHPHNIWAVMNLFLFLCFPALYPSAYRIKRGAYSLINPTFQRSSEDISLLFEILLSGMQIRGEEHTLLIPDEELASLRSVKKLEVICEDVLPKRLSDIRRLTAELAQRLEPLSWPDFERTVLTLVYTSQTLAQITDQHQRELWTNALIFTDFGAMVAENHYYHTS
uniref:Family with sequence similarity 180 member A n=1 Tax=Nothobranchius furzeri TaxID=105023 RepID=A0A8C6LXS7_NOTFU